MADSSTEAMTEGRSADVVIVGGGISGPMTAIYLRQRFPELSVVVVTKADSKEPIVGESLIEYSTHFLYELGFAHHLETHHLPKHGLTFYFKEKIEDPADRNYAVHAVHRTLPLPSHQLNRFTFAKVLNDRAREVGVEFVTGKVEQTVIREGGGSFVRYQDTEGRPQALEARWLVDASGRRGVLARSLGVRKRSPIQRSAYWFRLSDYDTTVFERINAVPNEPASVPKHHATHHFLGKGNWTWAIPMRSETGESLISVGLVYRPEFMGCEVRNQAQFLEQVSQEHPVLAELVASGTVIDENVYRNYMYEAERVYSEDGWFLVGDAANAVDPLYSMGLSLTSMQIGQVASLIEMDRNGSLTAEIVDDLDASYRDTYSMLQGNIASFYKVMHDPFQSHLRFRLDTAAWFFFMLPHWLKGYADDQLGARWMKFCIALAKRRLASLHALLGVASAKLGPLPASRMENHYETMTNWELANFEERDLPRYLGSLASLEGRVRLSTLRMAGWSGWWRHIPLALSALIAGALLRFAPTGRTLARVKRAVLRPFRVFRSRRHGGRKATQEPARLMPNAQHVSK